MSGRAYCLMTTVLIQVCKSAGLDWAGWVGESWWKGELTMNKEDLQFADTVAIAAMQALLGVEGTKAASLPDSTRKKIANLAYKVAADMVEMRQGFQVVNKPQAKL